MRLCGDIKIIYDLIQSKSLPHLVKTCDNSKRMIPNYIECTPHNSNDNNS